MPAFSAFRVLKPRCGCVLSRSDVLFGLRFELRFETLRSAFRDLNDAKERAKTRWANANAEAADVPPEIPEE